MRRYLLALAIAPAMALAACGGAGGAIASASDAVATVTESGMMLECVRLQAKLDLGLIPAERAGGELRRLELLRRALDTGRAAFDLQAIIRGETEIPPQGIRIARDITDAAYWPLRDRLAQLAG